jgi:cysteine desulfurase
MSDDWIYLDHNATTPPDPAVAEAMRPYVEGRFFGNPSSQHGPGRECRLAIDEAREKVAACLGAKREEILFTSGGTESINSVLKSLVVPRLRENPRIVISAIEHPAAEMAARQLEMWGCRVNRVPAPGGRLDREYLAEALKGRPSLFSFVLAESNTGSVQDGTALVEMAREAGVRVHVDAVQAVGKIPVNVHNLQADYLSFSAHKFYGPKGVGGLFVRAGREMIFSHLAGGGQEAGFRAGTENLAGIVGCGKALEIAADRMMDESVRVAGLRRDLMARLRQALPELSFLGDQENCLPNTLCVSLPGVQGQDWVIGLDIEKIAVSTGTACRSGSREPAGALLAMGYPEERVRGAFRISLGRLNESGHIERTVRAMTRLADRLRSFRAERASL